MHQGAQNLYDLEMEFTADGRVSDRQTTRFGIREITSELDNQNHRLFKVNGRNVLIRGGGWASDMFLRFMPDRLRTEFQYVKDMNLNAIRLEGQLQPDYFFDLADENGILIIAGWCCCSPSRRCRRAEWSSAADPGGRSPPPGSSGSASLARRRGGCDRRNPPSL